MSTTTLVVSQADQANNLINKVREGLWLKKKKFVSNFKSKSWEEEIANILRLGFDETYEDIRKLTANK